MTSKHTISLYLCSWDFWLAGLFTVIYVLFLHSKDGGLELNVARDVFKNFGIFVPILGIFITVFTLSMTILVTAIPQKFLMYLEEKGKVFSMLKQYHVVAFYIYFAAIVSNLSLQIYLNQEVPDPKNSNYIASDLVIGLYVISLFFSIYSFFYTLSLISHLSSIIHYRVLYLERYERNKVDSSESQAKLITQVNSKEEKNLNTSWILKFIGLSVITNLAWKLLERILRTRESQ